MNKSIINVTRKCQQEGRLRFKKKYMMTHNLKFDALIFTNTNLKISSLINPRNDHFAFLDRFDSTIFKFSVKERCNG